MNPSPIERRLRQSLDASEQNAAFHTLVGPTFTVTGAGRVSLDAKWFGQPAA